VISTDSIAEWPDVATDAPSRRLDAMVDVKLNDGRARIPKSRQGRPKVAHGFNRGLPVKNGQSPGGAKEKPGLDRCVLSSLTGLVLYSRHDPAMNRWAIFERPCGTWIHDTPMGIDFNQNRLSAHTCEAASPKFLEQTPLINTFDQSRPLVPMNLNSRGDDCLGQTRSLLQQRTHWH